MTSEKLKKIDTEAAARAIEAFLVAIGRDPFRDPELLGTGARVVDAYTELCAGYDVDVNALLRNQILAGDSALVTVRDLDVTTMCPHHLMPATGSATVAFQPKGRLIGIGVIRRVVEAFARRLTLQEHIGEGVTQTLLEHLRPAWVACRLDLNHTCTIASGDARHGTIVQTVSVRGDDAMAARPQINAVLFGSTPR